MSPNTLIHEAGDSMLTRIMLEDERRLRVDERSRLQRQVDLIDRKIAALDVLLEVDADTVDTSVTRDTPRVAVPSPRPLAPAPRGIRHATYELLHDMGYPMHYKQEIYPMLLARGVEIRGNDPINNLTSQLSHDERLERYGNGYWGLAEWHKNPPKQSPTPVPSLFPPLSPAAHTVADPLSEPLDAQEQTASEADEVPTYPETLEEIRG